MTAKKAAKKQVRIYLEPEDEKLFAEVLRCFAGWSESDVLTLITSAGLKALKACKGQFSWPMTFTLHQGSDPIPPAK